MASKQDTGSTANYVGNNTCGTCHENEYHAWTRSHHAQAMQSATTETVKGDFNNTEFDYFGIRSRFFKRDEGFYVNTEGPDGGMHDYQIKYTFGTEPLQQYLIEFPGGRLQSLTTAWDSRPASLGGQRWFHLYPKERIEPGDPLHWTGPYQNWNGMCAECHSTNLEKGYDAEKQSYDTRWSEINVSCQSCHGPGSEHVEWANNRVAGKADKSGQAGLINKPVSDPQYTAIEVCARCHSRRRQITAEDEFQQPFLDNFLPATLRAGLYYPDGQIQDEVYVYGSFLQSKMHRAGVICTDCHDPHSAGLKLAKNAICTQCHQLNRNIRFPQLPSKSYDSPDHHFHVQESEGAQCINCHMPERTYMVVDPRRDHSFRIPRPDLSRKLDTPNACNQCHEDQDPGWAAENIKQRHGTKRRQGLHYGEVFALARARNPKAIPGLLELLSDKTQPDIVRASAVEFLSPANLQQFQAVLDAAYDDNPLIQSSAITAMISLPPPQKVKALAPLLTDKSLSVRTEAARLLAAVPVELLSGTQQAALKEALDTYRAAQQASSDVIAGAHLNLAVLANNQGQPRESEQHYLKAIDLDPFFLPARVNLANLYNAMQRNPEAIDVLHEAISVVPEEGELHYSLGLLLAEENRLGDAAVALARASELLPDRTRVHYNYALALQHLGQFDKAEKALIKAYKTNTREADILQALVIFYVQRKRLDEAIRYAERIVELFPNEQRARQNLEQIKSMKKLRGQ